MLEQNDLQQIRGIVKEGIDSSLEDFAITVNKSFQEQREYLDEKFEGIDKRFEGIDKRFEGIDKRFEGIDKRFDRIDKELSAIRYELSDIRTRLEKLEEKVERIIKMETEDFMATTNEIDRVKFRLKLVEQKLAPVF